MAKKWALRKSVWLRCFLWCSALLLPSSFLCLGFCGLCAGHCLGFKDPADPNRHQGQLSLAKRTRCSFYQTHRAIKRAHSCRSPLPASGVMLRAPRLLSVPSPQAKSCTSTWPHRLFPRMLLLLFSPSWQGANVGCGQNYPSKATKPEGHSEPAVWSPQARGESQFKHPV